MTQVAVSEQTAKVPMARVFRPVGSRVTQPLAFGWADATPNAIQTVKETLCLD
jgi:hypothetical protein